MIDYDKIKLYLPKYLSPDSKEELFSALNAFPESMENIFYSNLEFDFLSQGDAIRNLIISDLPNTTFKNGVCIILSNTCDLSKSNDRAYRINIVYSPIVELRNFINFMQSNHIPDTRIEGLVNSIKRQEVTSIMYLPKSSSLEESVVFFDRVNSCDPDSSFFSTIKDKRLFTLSNYGNYLFILKLSIHFTRITEDFDRDDTIELVYKQPGSGDPYSYN